MTITVISIKRKKGTFEGRDYDNTEVCGFVQNSTNEQVLCGQEVEICKFKTPVFTESLERNVAALNSPNVKETKDLVGLNFVPVYNKFGNCEDFILSVPEGNNRKK